MRRASACQACLCWARPGRPRPGRSGQSGWPGPVAGLAGRIAVRRRQTGLGRSRPGRAGLRPAGLPAPGQPGGRPGRPRQSRLMLDLRRPAARLRRPSWSAAAGREACCQRPGSGPAACGWSGPSCRGPPPAGTRLPAGLRQARGPRRTGASRPDRCGPAAGQAQRPDPRLPRGSPPSGDSSAGCCDRPGPRPAGRPRPGRTRREGWFPYPSDGLWPGRCQSPRYGTCRARSPAGPGWLVRRPRRSAGSLRTRCR